MADWAAPVLPTAYSSFLSNLKDRDTDAATMAQAPTTPPTGYIRYNTSTDKLQRWDGAAWNNILAAAGLGTMSLQDSDNVSITGGTIGGAVNLDAARLTSNLVATARLGSGTPSANNSLAGNQTWKSFPPVGVILQWLTASPPTGWLICDGSAVSRTTYATLFALWGTTFGVGDGSTTFNLADLRGRLLLGKTAAGTGSTLNGQFGTLDHAHTGPLHSHTTPNHAHTVASHTHSDGTLNVDNHSHTFTTGINDEVWRVTSGTDHYVADDGHIHSGTTSAEDPGISGETGAAAPITDTSGGGSTGAAGDGSTGANNSPMHAVHHIVKALD